MPQSGIDTDSAKLPLEGSSVSPSRSQSALLSIIIINWRADVYLVECLESIAKNSPCFLVETILVDNEPEREADRADRFSSLCTRYVSNEKNLGYTKAVNQGLEMAVGKYLLLLNPDTIIQKGSLEGMVTFLERHPRAAAVGCRLLSEKGENLPSCQNFPTFSSLLYEMLGLSTIFPRSSRFAHFKKTYWAHDEETRVDHPMGACLLIRREALEMVGFLDDEYFLYFSDMDWCYRARASGWEIWFTPFYSVVHHGARSTDQMGMFQKLWIHHRDFLRYVQKNHLSSESSFLRKMGWRLLLYLRLVEKGILFVLYMVWFFLWRRWKQASWL